MLTTIKQKPQKNYVNYDHIPPRRSHCIIFIIVTWAHIIIHITKVKQQHLMTINITQK